MSDSEPYQTNNWELVNDAAFICQDDGTVLLIYSERINNTTIEVITRRLKSLYSGEVISEERQIYENWAAEDYTGIHLAISDRSIEPTWTKTNSGDPIEPRFLEKNKLTWWRRLLNRLTG